MDGDQGNQAEVLIDEDQIVPQVRSKPITLDDGKLQDWAPADDVTQSRDLLHMDSDLTVGFVATGSDSTDAVGFTDNAVPPSDNLELVAEDAIVPQSKTKAAAIDVDLDAVFQGRAVADVEEQLISAIAASSQLSAAPPSSDPEVIEVRVVPGRVSQRKDWLKDAASGLNDDEFAWMAVEVEPTAQPRFSTSSDESSVVVGADAGGEEIISAQVVQQAFRAPSAPPVDEDVIVPQKKAEVESSIDFGKLSIFDSATGVEEETVVERPAAVVECRPPSFTATPLSRVQDDEVDRRDDAEVVEESVGPVRVSVKRLDEILAGSKIEFEPIGGDVRSRTVVELDSPTDLEPPLPEGEELIAVTTTTTQFARPLPPVVEEDLIVPQKKSTGDFVPDFAALEVEAEREENERPHREMAVDVPPNMEAAAGIDAGVQLQVTPPTVDVSAAASIQTPQVNDVQKAKPESGGGVFGFLKRKPKNGKNGGGELNDEEARKKSNSLGKKVTPPASEKNADSAGTFPLDAKKEKNGRGTFHIGINFGGKGKEKTSGVTQPTVDVGGEVTGDEDLESSAKKRPSSAGAKSPRKTNIRIFEIMASNGAGENSVKEPTAKPAPAPAVGGSPPPDEQHPSSADATVFCPVGPPAKGQIEVQPSAGGRGGVDGPTINVSAAVPALRVDSAPPLKSAVAADLSATSPSTPPSSYIVAVAIDFGTAFSGYAFSFTHDADDSSNSPSRGGASVHMMGKWEGGDPGVINQKTPSTLLLTPEGRFHSFGFTARNFYHDLTPEEADSWLYFDKFKMSLYNASECNSETRILAANGTPFPAFQAVAMTLSFFKQHALQELNTQCGTRILEEDVRWVITVPAIWNAQAKQFMRMAAYEAGIGSPEKSDQLLIALEPEAASIHIRRLRMHQLVPDKPIRRPLSIRQEADLLDAIDLQRVSTKFNQRVTRYMVVDCGGGTVDITVHELDAVTAKLQELHKASGGPHGSCGIDSEFERLMNAIFGAESMKLFRRRHPSGWICLMMAFESRKRAANPNKTTPLNISLPFTFIDFYHKHTGSTVETAISKYGDKDIRWSSQGMLRMTQDAMKKLFQPTLDNIGQTVAAVLEHPRLKDVHYIFLVGGLSESPLVQQDMRQRFGTRAQVIVPQEASLAVLKGAVCFGLDQSVVSVRRSRYTYGAAVLKRFVRGRHPESKLLRRAGGDWCRDVFDTYVVADQVVNVGDVVVRRYAPATASQSYITIAIYCSPNSSPTFTTDEGVTKCATIRLDLPSTTARQGTRVIETRMTFADTEIKVAAVDTSTGQHVNAAMDFFNV